MHAKLAARSETSNVAKVVGTGFTVLDRIYATGQPEPFEALGGSCGNVLVSLALLGHSVAPLVTLGADRQGDYLRAEFQRAGCFVDMVVQRQDYGSPIIAEHVDLQTGRHWFSFKCPETDSDFPRWKAVDDEQVKSAADVLRKVSVFYTDRLTQAVVDAMEQAKADGALVFFEPAKRGAADLLRRALRAASIVKLSDETDASNVAAIDFGASTLVIRTHGSAGLTASIGDERRFFPASSAPRLVDPCGSGDMVTVGLLDHLLRKRSERLAYSAQDFFDGIAIGQRLAALNCAFAGARGVFYAFGAQNVQSAIDGGLPDRLFAQALAYGPFRGYGPKRA
jgi:fructokinase